MQVTECFYSIQGEGSLAGVPSYFIRFAGCNLGCAWCDTPYASRTTKGQSRSVASLLKSIKKLKVHHVVLTGGEPLLQPDLAELATGITDLGAHVTIETNGTIPPAGIRCSLVSLSPKLSHSIPRSAKSRAEHTHYDALRIQLPVLRDWIKAYPFQLKFVVSRKADIAEITGLIADLRIPIPPEQVFLMPEGIRPKTLAARTPFIVEACKKYGFRYGGRLQVSMFGGGRGV